MTAEFDWFTLGNYTIGREIDDIHLGFLKALQNSSMSWIGYSNPVGVVARRVPDKLVWRRDTLKAIND